MQRNKQGSAKRLSAAFTVNARMERLGSATGPVKREGGGRALRESAEVQCLRFGGKIFRRRCSIICSTASDRARFPLIKSANLPIGSIQSRKFLEGNGSNAFPGLSCVAKANW